MDNVNEMLAEQQRELERVRNKRGKKMDTTTIRKILNVVFLVLAVVGLALYFFLPEKRSLGWLLIAIGMVLKIIEFFLRFLF